jgi:hypothetical protein
MDLLNRRRVILILFALVLLKSPLIGQEVWYEIFPNALPPERSAFGMVHNKQTNRPVLFGGFNSSGPLDDTWEFQENTWVELFPPAKPPARYFHTFTYRDSDGSAFVLGGLVDNKPSSEMWKLESGTWTKITSSEIPPARHSHAAAYDSKLDALYVYGGLGEDNEHRGDFRAYQADAWTMVNSLNAPGPLYGHAMVYDPSRNQMVLFGGANASNTRVNDTWIYKNSEWALLPTQNAPSPRIFHKMAYDPDQNVILLFGGFEQGKRLNDLWIFDGENWTPRSTTLSPEKRSSHEMVYDSKSQRLHCFGGIGATNNYYKDNWVLFEKDLSFDKEIYISIHDQAVISVSDLSGNQDPSAKDTIFIALTSTTDPVGIALPLTETDINTGVFTCDEADQKLKFSLIESNQDLRQIQVKDGDTIRASYVSALDGREITATTQWIGAEAIIELDKQVYIGTHDSAIITIYIEDENVNPNVIETIQVLVTSDPDPTGFPLILQEISENSGIFTFPKGQKNLTFSLKATSKSKTEIYVEDGRFFTITYVNKYDGRTYINEAQWVRSAVKVEFDKKVYETTQDKAYVTLYDDDLNIKSDVTETIWQKIYSDTDPKGLEIPFIETGLNTGIFKPDPISFSAFGTSFINRVIHVTDGDVLTIKYEKYLQEPVYATAVFSDGTPKSSRPEVYIIFGPREGEVTSDTVVTFHFTACGAAFNINPRDVEFQTMLQGLEDNWSPWIQGTTRTYKDLPGGNYKFMVRARTPKSFAPVLEPVLSLPVFRSFYILTEDESPLVPPRLVATPGDLFVKLDWTHDYRENMLGYFIYRREEGKNTITLNTLPLDPNLSTYTDQPLVPCTRYEYFIRALDKEGQIKDSNKVWCAAALETPGTNVLYFNEDTLDMSNYAVEAKLEISNNTRTEPICWTLYTDTPALSVYPASGISSGEITKVNVRLNRTGFTPGFYELNIFIRSNAASYWPPLINEKKAVTIKFSIPGPVIHNTHSFWEPSRIPNWQDVQYAFVDITPVGVGNWRILLQAPLKSPDTVDLSELGMGIRPLQTVHDVAPTDSYLFNGDLNGQIDAGEKVSLSITELNDGDVEARSVSAVFYSRDEYVEIVGGNKLSFNNLAGHAKKKGWVNFKVSQNLPSVKDGYPFILDVLLVDSDGYEWLSTINLKAFIHPSNYSYSVDDDTEGFSYGNNNQIMEVDENIEIPITTHNPGANELPSIIYYLDRATSTTPVLISRASLKSDYPIPPYSSQNVETDFELTVSPIYAGDQLDFHLYSAFLKPYLYDSTMVSEDSLCHYNSSLPHPDGKLDSEGSPIMCPIVGFAYSYVIDNMISFNRKGLLEKVVTLGEGADPWNFSGEVLPFVPPEFGVNEDSIYLKSANNTNCFGFWESPPEYLTPIQSNNLYRARWTIQTDLEDYSISPSVRFRVFDNLGQVADVLHIASEGSGVFAPNTHPRDYDLYFIPNQEAGNSLRFAFDLINMNPNDANEGTVFLNKLQVERTPLESLPDPFRIRNYSFFNDAEGWEFGAAPPLLTPPIGYQSNDDLIITGVDENTFGFWTSPADDITLGENMRIWSAEFHVRRDFETQQDQVPTVRFRLNALNNQACVFKQIDSANGGEASPSGFNKSYKIFFLSPTDQAGKPIQNVPLQASFDFINIGTHDFPTATMKLDDVFVDVYPPDIMP